MTFLKRLVRPRRAAFSDGVIDLVPEELGSPDETLGIQVYYTFKICLCGTRRVAGQISLRVGESQGMYYLGHIGYHVNRAYQGHRYAQRACRLLIPLCQALKLRSLVITTDEDNTPSRKTCEGLGCVLESIVPVPLHFQHKYQLSPAKCRYIWLIPPKPAQES